MDLAWVVLFITDGEIKKEVVCNTWAEVVSAVQGGKAKLAAAKITTQEWRLDSVRLFARLAKNEGCKISSTTGGKYAIEVYVQHV